VTVVYDTSVTKLRKIPGMIRAIIEASPNTRFDRAHFARFTEYGLDFEVVYFITLADYNKYMDTQQEINLQIMEAFEKEEIGFMIRERWMTKLQSTVNGPQSTAPEVTPQSVVSKPQAQTAGQHA
jgi:small-conductance mechanosensitive channel